MNNTNLIKLQEKLYSQIPMTEKMQLKINSINDKYFYTKSSLDVNINDKGSAFGGSLSSICIISAWSLVYLITQDLGFEDYDILIIKNESSFTKQVTKDIICKCTIPSQKDITILKEKLEIKNSASMKIEAHIIENNSSCMSFTGTYVIKKKA